MKKGLQKAERIILQHDVWVYLSFILLMALIELNQEEVDSWSVYLRRIGFYTLCLLPILVFEVFKNRLKSGLKQQKYWLVWSSCYLAYPLALSLFRSELILICLIFLMLAVVLEVNAAIRKLQPVKNWLRKINLETAIVLTLFLIALLIAMMAVSSYGDPRFHKEQLLIGFVVDFEKILAHFWLFCSLLLQFFFLYMVGYFFYAINHYFLVSRLLKERGILYYFLGVLGTVVLFYPFFAQLIVWLPFNKLFGHIFPLNPFHLEDGWGAFAVILFTLPIILAIQWFKQNTRIISLEKQQTETELSLLKHQINPHFFFNTLNNLYALSLHQSKQTPEVVLQLSELMRYVLYRANQEQVMLAEELKYIEDYIQLQQIRLAGRSCISFSKDIRDDTVLIAPMLLIILVENAFKHGIEPAAVRGYCTISITSNHEKMCFVCENSCEEEAPRDNGIGLHNLKKRLELLYPGRHTLTLEKHAIIFRATLTLHFL